MTFVRPFFLFALLLALVPAVLFLSRYIRSQKENFPAADYLFGQDKRPLKQLRSRQIGITLLRMGLIVLVVLAFAGPRLSPSPVDEVASPDNDELLVMDVSASMGTTNASGETLLAEARKLLSKRLANSHGEAHFAVVPCPLPNGFELQWQEPEGAKTSLDALEPQWESCHLADTLERLQATLSKAPAGLAATDLRLLPEDRHKTIQFLFGAPHFDVLSPSPRGPNISLQDLRSSPTGLSVAVHSDGDKPGEVVLQWTCGEQSVSQSVEIPGKGLVVVEGPSLDSFESGICRVEAPLDSVPYDNEQWFELHKSRRLQVVLVDGSPAADPTVGPAHYVHSALAASDKGLSVVSISQTELTYDQLSVADLLVLVDPLPLPEYIANGILDFLHRGGGVIVVAGRNLVKWEKNSPLLGGATFRLCASSRDHPFHIGWMDREDPVSAGIHDLAETSLHSWTHLRHMAVMLTEPETTVAARFTDGAPALVRVQKGAGELVIWTAPPTRDNGNTVYHPLFPIWMKTVVERLLPSRFQVEVPPMCTVGLPCSLVGEGLSSQQFAGPHRKAKPVTSDELGNVVCNQPGPHFLRVGRDRHLAFVCLPREDELMRPRRPLENVERRPAPALPPPPPPLNYDWLLLLGGMALVFLELWLLMGRHVRRA